MKQTVTSIFDKKWEALNEELSVIKGLDILPLNIDEDGESQIITENSLIENIFRLKNDKFTIAICGQVKTGKSSFLNSILFGKQVLPTFETPLTAKLTFIEYTEESDYFEVTYYSEDEWKQLREEIKGTQLESDLSKRLEKCQEYGVNYTEVIGNPVETVDGLHDLELYVTDPTSGAGKFTPFVKSVAIYINNEAIKNITLVDTPGLNDSNIINSKETEKWIKDAHAPVFLLQPKGATAADIGFFERHLIGTEPSSRIFVINKIDGYEEKDINSVVAYLKNLGKTPDYINMGGLFGAEEKICRYSALLSLLQSTLKDKPQEEWTEEEEFYYRSPEKFNPDPDNVKKVLAERLYNNEGKLRIGRGISAMEQVYANRIRILGFDINNWTAKKENCSKTKEDLDGEIKKLNTVEKNLRSIMEKMKEQCQDDFFKIKCDFMKNFKENVNKLYENNKTIGSTLGEEGSKNKLHELKSQVNELSIKISELVYKLQGEINGKNANNVEKLKNEFSKQGIDEVFNCVKIKEKETNIINLEQAIKETLDEALDAVNTVYFSKKGRAASFNESVRNVCDSCILVCNKQVQIIGEKFKRVTEDNYKQVATTINDHCNSKKNIMNESAEKRKKQASDLESKITQAQDEITKIKTASSNFKVKMR